MSGTHTKLYPGWRAVGSGREWELELKPIPSLSSIPLLSFYVTVIYFVNSIILVLNSSPGAVAEVERHTLLILRKSINKSKNTALERPLLRRQVDVLNSKFDLISLRLFLILA